MGYSFVIYNASEHDSHPQVESRLRIIKGGKPVYSSAFRPVEGLSGSTSRRIMSAGALTLGKLAPGDYTLEVLIVDKLRKKESRGTARQEIDFSIE